ncbi:MAG: DUF2088 domain-containing protein [Actinobacteria bacterium]|nr:DUF2088 domain-containing protein [Actinomycetota bacterium]
MDFPRMVDIVQEIETSPLVDPEEELEADLSRDVFSGLFMPGRRTAIAVGSRRISGLVEVLSYIVSRVKKSGGTPFIVPAMGSHGGATPEGQVKVLESLGVTEETTGAPIISSPEVECLGETPGGATVYVDKNALQADALIVVNRVAPHSGYSGPVQSGLQKMIAAGLGKWEGARSLHKQGFEAAHLIGEMADLVLSNISEVMGVAMIEDGRKNLSDIEALYGGEIKEREHELLALARSMYPGIPVEEADILVVDEIGKDISGAGMDPMITGRGKIFSTDEAVSFSAKRIVVLNLSEGSLGNANGIGHADITTRELYESTDWESTYRNAVISGQLYRVRIPVIAETDKKALSLALESLGGKHPDEVRLVRIKNTRELHSMQVSTAIENELQENPRVSVYPGGKALSFSEEGELL